MTIEEKLQLLEEMLRLPKGSLSPEAPLDSLDFWDSLTMLNLQMELLLYREDVTLDMLRACETVEQLCRLIP